MSRRRSMNPQPDGPLAWLHARRDRQGRRLIDDIQLEAGERFAADAHRARIVQRITSSWSPAAPSQGAPRATPGAGVELADSVVAARQCMSAALDALGPELAGIVLDVCGLGMGVEEAERRKGWPPRSGKVVLALALTRLARHYQMGPGEGDHGAEPGTTHWAAADSRPSLDRW